MNEITYTRIGDYLLPNITLKESPPETIEPLGRYGKMHKAFLKEHRPALYNELLLTERLYPLLREVDKTAMARLSQVTAEQRLQAEEIILSELVYN
jgi:hypothetical protein